MAKKTLMTNNSDKTVYVGLSGGVDSSVSAALLKEAGYDVVGVFIKVWHPPFLECDWKKERRDAMRVCAKLNIPFKTIDLSDEYKREVVDYMIEEYRSGRTPNPDVMCNKHIKFGAFFEEARKEGADYVATGHYARIAESNDVYQLRAGRDQKKDQSYFLWTLTQAQLAHTIFPVGTLHKSRVRSIAKQRDLFTANKDDSQGLCFLGPVDMKSFLERFIKTEPGDVLNKEGGAIGRHSGAVLYTIGQRHGFEVTKKAPDDGPWYVAEKDVKNNTITVTQKKTEESSLYNGKSITLSDTNWISGDLPPTNKVLSARIRYNQPLQPCHVTISNQRVRVVFESPQHAVAIGQSLVLYDGDICLGGGIIESTQRNEVTETAFSTTSIQ